MNFSKKILLKLSIAASILSTPAFAEENSGWYTTGSIGRAQISDIDYKNSTQKVQFDSGLNFDLGFGYDFGSTRIEGTWNRAQSPGGTDRLVVFNTVTTIDSFLLSGFYDFRSSKQWSPFIGISVGSTNVDHLQLEDTGTSYGLNLGISYKTSNNSEIYFKSTGIVTPELDTLSITDGNYVTGTIGARVIF